ncbi:MAG: anthranilate/aminodeoxychorismate synthase component II [Alcanivorax sp.]|nr:anthranilate/aminodeoxychorismate synthase component II [Alcanivorax sp.]MAY10339.1 anthranilate/aminodeoxychorismate synthase component II [Alcanivorax sp.]HCE41162.1 anthranilate/aminodeoxychorismate synthase component II [Alcanivorax sp.]|tara:strand:- start:8628 stop:9206 length:579 start_codon:yes stop_codon:yes gene_type:complete
MIDNYDSFTYNLVQYLQELGAEVLVHRNDRIDLAGMEVLNADRLMISPGPCTPNEAGISVEAIRHFAGKLPILGVCLGHQALGQAFGAKVVRARTVMHGKTSPVHHTGQGVFRGLPSPYVATRYHSLVVDKATLPDCFEITAWTEDDNGDMDEIMGMCHKDLPLEGVQYHPESILTEHGHDLLNNFLKGESA